MGIRVLQNTGGDAQINRDDWNAWRLDMRNPKELVAIKGDDGDIHWVGTLEELQTKINSGGFSLAAEVIAPKQADARAQAAGLEPKLEELLAKIKDAEANHASTKELQAELRELIKQAEAHFKAGGKNLFDLGKFKAAAGAELPGEAKAATISSQGSEGAAQSQGAKAQGQGGGGGASSFPPAGWAAQTWGGPQFNPSAYLQAQTVEENILSSWDSVNQNVNRGKQLMMLFFYFAKMAESGDMGAMYRFMSFITFIVSKDKAKQQIEMGKKLIQLQDLSRSFTNKLMGLSTNANDPTASNELMKTMTIVKSETDAIATSQKLISQMMEEFAQVVETLTNTTKAALETTGRIQRTVSQIRG